MVLIYAKGRADEIKIGFSVSKKLGNAVERNRIKRRLREAVTPLIPNIKTGCKLIIIAKLPIKTEKLPAIESSMRYMMKKANLLVNSESISEAKDSIKGSTASKQGLQPSMKDSKQESSLSMKGQGSQTSMKEFLPSTKGSMSSMKESSPSVQGQGFPPSMKDSSSPAEGEKRTCKQDCTGKVVLQASTSRAGESECGTYE